MSSAINNLPNIQKHKKYLDFNIDLVITSLKDLKTAMNDNNVDKLHFKRFDIAILSRVISRYTGLLARAIDSAKKPKKEYPQPVVKSTSVGQSVNPANQELVNALIEKANSYPDDKGYQKNAYITVAENIIKNNKVISLRTYRWRPDLFNIEGIEVNVGKSTGQFIIDYLKSKPDTIRVVQ